jgi:hypothetical protein
VHLLTEAQRHLVAVAAITSQRRAGRGVTDRSRELVGRDRHTRRHGAVLRAVKAHDRVEVHQAAGLELGDLRVRHASELAPLTLAEPGTRRSPAPAPLSSDHSTPALLA